MLARRETHRRTAGTFTTRAHFKKLVSARARAPSLGASVEALCARRARRHRLRSEAVREAGTTVYRTARRRRPPRHAPRKRARGYFGDCIRDTGGGRELRFGA